MLYSCTHMATVGVKGLNNFYVLTCVKLKLTISLTILLTVDQQISNPRLHFLGCKRLGVLGSEPDLLLISVLSP